MSTYVETNVVEDEIRYLDLGIEDVRDFFNVKLTKLGLSYDDDFELGNYKIAGLSVFRQYDQVVYGRSIYDILAFLGDVGGLEGIVLLIGGVLIAKMAAFMVTVKMAPHLFYYRKNNEP